MTFDVGLAMILLTIGAFLLGVMVGRWPAWSARRRAWILTGWAVAAVLFAGFWAFISFASIDPHSMTYNVMMYGDQYTGRPGHGYWGRQKDGWNRPFVHTLGLDQESTHAGDASGKPRDVLTFEVRSLGPNGVRGDDDDIWVEYAIETGNGELQLVGRKWGGMNGERPEDWTLPREDRDPPPSTAPLPPATTDGTMKP